MCHQALFRVPCEGLGTRLGGGGGGLNTVWGANFQHIGGVLDSE